MRKTTLVSLAFATSLACGGAPSPRGPLALPPAGNAAVTAPVAPGPPLVPSPESAIFAAHLARNGDMTYEQLRSRMGNPPDQDHEDHRGAAECATGQFLAEKNVT